MGKLSVKLNELGPVYYKTHSRPSRYVSSDAKMTAVSGRFTLSPKKSLHCTDAKTGVSKTSIQNPKKNQWQP
jgi:hypothetical protein